MLSRIQYTLLTNIINLDARQSNKLFNKRDNTFIQSNRGIAKALGVPPSSVDRLFRVCKEKGLIKLVTDNQGIDRWMLNPSFLWYNNREEKPLARFMFSLGSYDAAILWRKECERLGMYIDPLTGEAWDFNWSPINAYAQSYQSWDFNWRKTAGKEIN